MDEQHTGFRAWMNLMRVHQTIQQKVIDLMARYGLTLAQFDVLVQLQREEGITQQQLADRLLVTKGNVTGLIDRLEREKLVERRSDSEDRRSNLLYLTDSGSAQILQILPEHKTQLRTLMDILSREKQEQLLTLLQELEEGLKAGKGQFFLI